jgi:hypothetical protein
VTTWKHRQPCSDDLEDDDSYYNTRPHTSAIRYNAPLSRQGNASQQPAPAQVTRRRVHWLVYVGLLFMVGIIGWLAITILGAWWQAKQDDWTYGMPRTYQTDVVVGHDDSASHPSHFIAQNLNGEIVVIEYPGGDVSKARSYVITTLPGDDGYSPVRLSFRDVNGDRKLDMLVQIGDPGSQVQVILYNNGQQFTAKP